MGMEAGGGSGRRGGGGGGTLVPCHTVGRGVVPSTTGGQVLRYAAAGDPAAVRLGYPVCRSQEPPAL